MHILNSGDANRPNYQVCVPLEKESYPRGWRGIPVKLTCSANTGWPDWDRIDRSSYSILYEAISSRDDQVNYLHLSKSIETVRITSQSQLASDNFFNIQFKAKIDISVICSLSSDGCRENLQQNLIRLGSCWQKRAFNPVF